MKRVVSIGNLDDSELHRVSATVAEASTARGRQFVAAVEAALDGLQVFPFAYQVDTVVSGMEIRRAPLVGFSYLLHYFIFPSVDPQILKGLDVVFILSCRHVRQEQPDWEMRDPFNL